jgi:hypothetical protein
LVNAEDLNRLIALLEARVGWVGNGQDQLQFSEPTVDELVALGCEADDASRVLAAQWWPEMVEEILETPDFCEPGEAPEAVLTYARDVIGEYFRKRFEP